MITRPQSDEYASYYADYIQRVPEGEDFFALLSRQPEELHILLQSLSDAQANIRPALGEWSVKEVIGHLCDIERVWTYQAMRCSKGDTTPLPGFDYEAYVRASDYNAYNLMDLIECFTAQRRANVLYFKSLTPADTERRGTAGDFPMTVRARLFMIVGHVMHHIESLKMDYKVKG